jgi:hypothetical protein
MKELWHTFENIKSQKNLKDVKRHLMSIDQWQKWLKMLKSWFLPVLGGYHKYLRISLGHLSLILSGYHHEWHPDWKSSYRFPLMWESDVKTSFSTVYSHYKWNIQPGKSGASRWLTIPHWPHPGKSLKLATWLFCTELVKILVFVLEGTSPGRIWLWNRGTLQKWNIPK